MILPLSQSVPCTIGSGRASPNRSLFSRLAVLLTARLGLLALLLGWVASSRAWAIGQAEYLSFSAESDGLALIENGESASIFFESSAWPGVARAAHDLQSDVQRVSGILPSVLQDTTQLHGTAIIVGTLGKSALIDRLIADKKLSAEGLRGKWESFSLQVVDNPLPNVKRALIIVGSDKRGTIFGIYDLSEQMGVSPWYWWADVPATHHDTIYVRPGAHRQGPPSVKYRGIFLNDEAPDLTNWVQAKFGLVPDRPGLPPAHRSANYNHEVYARFFEVLLRLKANYLWPAMWNNAFNEDDPENARLADEYGIVMGTSHQEPMLRAQKEWDRRYYKTLGSWNYATHPDILEDFWREGIRRNRSFESIITMGLRGADDTPMAEGGPEANRALLEKIVGRQRKILAEEMNPDVAQIPQVWCLYKEVMDFYNAGMRVPDDVTLLWAEDNWGNVRRLPDAAERQRAGGAGVYYHFDYHGGPRSYQWINTTQLPKIWDQMQLAKKYGADRVWIVNVGHFKGYEFPLEYFIDLGWNTDRWTADNFSDFSRSWAAREFGPAFADEIADIQSRFCKFSARRKPELVDSSTYSLVNYREFETVVAEFEELTARAEKVFAHLPPTQRDAFYQLVLFPTKASSIVNQLYLAAARNRLYAQQGRASANDFAALTRSLFQSDLDLMRYYNTEFIGGKWAHFMDQSHLGYLAWNDPPTNTLRAIKLTDLSVPAAASLGVAVEGSSEAWPGPATPAALPVFDVFTQATHFVELFNRGSTAFPFTIKPSAPWITVSSSHGAVEKDVRVWVSVDWEHVPAGQSTGSIEIAGASGAVTVAIQAFKPVSPKRDELQGFVESAGVVSVEAEHVSANRPSGDNQWVRIDDYGRTLSGMRATGHVDLPAATPGKDSPCLEYRIYTFTTGTVELTGIFSPTLNFQPGQDLRYALSIDDGPVQTVTLVPKTFTAMHGFREWERGVSDNARISHTKVSIPSAGYHTVKFWMVSPGVVLEKWYLDLGGAKASYFGPPESYRHN